MPRPARPVVRLSPEGIPRLAGQVYRPAHERQRRRPIQPPPAKPINGGLIGGGDHTVGTGDSLVSLAADFADQINADAIGSTYTAFTDGSTQTITGTLTLKGDAGQLLSLRSSTPTSLSRIAIGTPRIERVS